MKLDIIGGTYEEYCHYQDWAELYGSGLRAATVASFLSSEVTFHTLAAADTEAPLRAKAHGSKFNIGQITTIPSTIRFHYGHALSRPEISPCPESFRNWKTEALNIKSESILRFGLIEGDARVEGDFVIYDPQNPHSPELFTANGSTAKHLAIVCNQDEGRKLTNKDDASAIADHLIRHENANVVVIKRGSHGALVRTKEQERHVSAFQTKHVWPIGSGDVFAATFAHYWASEQKDPFVAADLASKAAAYYCETRDMDVKHGISVFNSPPTKPLPPGKSVYLAGPFFTLAQIWQINEAKMALSAQGFDVFSPLHSVGRGPAHVVYPKDIEALEKCDVVYAILDGLDTGTIYEIGYAKALKKEVVVFVQNENHDDLKMLIGGSCYLEDDFATSIYRTSWIAAE